MGRSCIGNDDRHTVKDQAGRERVARARNLTAYRLEHTVPFEKAIDLVEDLETQHMLQLGLAQMSASPARPLASASEIRFVGLRNRMEILIEVIVHVLG